MLLGSTATQNNPNSSWLENNITSRAEGFKVAHISELNQAQLSQLADTIVGRARLEEELHQAHLLTAKQGAHSCLHKMKEKSPN